MRYSMTITHSWKNGKFLYNGWARIAVRAALQELILFSNILNIKYKRISIYEWWSVYLLKPICTPSQYKYDIPWYRDFHYKDKTVVRPSYLYNGNAYIILRRPPDFAGIGHWYIKISISQFRTRVLNIQNIIFGDQFTIYHWIHPLHMMLGGMA